MLFLLAPLASVAPVLADDRADDQGMFAVEGPARPRDVDTSEIVAQLDEILGPVGQTDPVLDPVTAGRIPYVVGLQRTDDTGAARTWTAREVERLVAPWSRDVDAELVRFDQRLAFAEFDVAAADEAAFALSASMDPAVAYAKVDGKMSALFIPDDPKYAQQWGPAAIGMETAWDTARGNHSVKVAVLDTGIDAAHPDLVDNVCGSGTDYVNGDNDADDDHYHGTHVSGTIAATIDNGVGVAGVADVCVTGFKVLSAWGSGQWSWLATALMDVADQGYDIASMSLGGCAGCDPGEPLTSAVDYAADKGLLMIAAAGNAYCSDVGYPAAYTEMIAVASLDEPGDAVSSFSSCGPEVELAAPGRDVVSTVPTWLVDEGHEDEPYFSLSGTSMATPHVAGAAALLKSIDPALDRDDLRCILATGASDLLGLGRDEKTGFGRIDVATNVADMLCAPLPPEATELLGRSGDATATLQWATAFAIGGVEGYKVYRSDDGGAFFEVADTTGRTFIDTAVSVGDAPTYAVAAYNSAGTAPLSANVTIQVRAALDVPVLLDFENGLEGWTLEGDAWEWSTDPGSPSTTLFYNGSFDSSPQRDAVEAGGWLESPPIRLPETGPLALDLFVHEWVGGETGLAPRLQVATEAAPFSYEAHWAMGGYIEYSGGASVDLSDLAGQVVYLRFEIGPEHYVWESVFGVHFDDLHLSAVNATQYEPLIELVSPRADVSDVPWWPMSGLAAVGFEDPNGIDTIASASIQIDGADPGLETFGGPFFYVALYDGLSHGNHSIEATVSDDAGASVSDASTFQVDAVLPEIEVDAPASGAVIGCTLTASGTIYDAHALPHAARLYVNGWGAAYDGNDTNASRTGWTMVDEWVTPELPAGPFQVEYVAYDRAGNRNNVTASYDHDDTGCLPEVEIVSPSSGHVASCSLELELVLSASGGNELRNAYVSVDGRYVDGRWFSDGMVETNLTMLFGFGDFPNGTHEVEVEVMDSAWRSSVAVVDVERDDTVCGPALTVAQPSNGAAVGCSVAVGGMAEGRSGWDARYVEVRSASGIVNSYYLDGPVHQWSGVYSTGPLTSGVHDLTFTAYDVLGNRGDQVVVPVERSETDCRPDLAIDVPTVDTVVTCYVDVTGDATANSGFDLDQIEVRLDGRAFDGIWLHGQSQTSFTERVYLNAYLPTGAGTLDFIVRDYGQNERTVSVDVDVAESDCAPVVRITSPATGSVVEGVVEVTFDLDLYDDDGSADVELMISGPTSKIHQRVLGEGAHVIEWDTRFAEAGSYFLWLEVEDDVYRQQDQDHIFVAVEVGQQPFTVDHQTAGNYGCGVGVAFVRTADLCDGGGHPPIEVDEGVSGVRIDLYYEVPDDPVLAAAQGDVSFSASLVARPLGHAFEVAPGHLRLVYHNETGFLNTDPAELKVHVHAEHADPNVPFDVEYQIEATTGHFGAIA